MNSRQILKFSIVVGLVITVLAVASVAITAFTGHSMLLFTLILHGFGILNIIVVALVLIVGNCHK